MFAFLSQYRGLWLHARSRRMAHGAVPVVLDTPVAREIYGEAAVRVADGPALVADVAAALTPLLDDAAVAGALSGARRRRCWRATAGRRPRGAHAGARWKRRRVSEPSLAIVIVSYNVRADLERCLRSLVGRTGAAAPRPSRWSTTRSTDGTLRMLARTTGPRVRAIDAGGNVGFSRANNLGIRATASDLVLLLNPDTEVTDGAAADAGRGRCWPTRGAAAAGPRLVDGDGRPELSFGPHDVAVGRVPRSAGSCAPTSARAPVGRAARRAAHREAGRATGSAAPACWRGAPTSRPSACSTSATSCTPRTSTSAPRFRAQGRAVRFVPERHGAPPARPLGGAARRRPPSARRRESQLAFYRKHHPAWAPLLALVAAPPRRRCPIDFSRPCGLSSTRASSTTSASARISATW